LQAIACPAVHSSPCTQIPAFTEVAESRCLVFLLSERFPLNRFPVNRRRQVCTRENIAAVQSLLPPRAQKEKQGEQKQNSNLFSKSSDKPAEGRASRMISVVDLERLALLG
jgi:hypothetical protein